MFETFRSPPKSARPMVRWWWTGTDLEAKELLMEVHELDAAGFLGAEIQAFMVGSPMDLAKSDPARYRRSHRFMQPYYYEVIKAVLEEGAGLGMAFDLTIGSAWPAGGVHVLPADSQKTLFMGAATLPGGRRYVGPVPQYSKPFLYRADRYLGPLQSLLTFYPQEVRLIRVVAAKPTRAPGEVRSVHPQTAYFDPASFVDLTAMVDANGVLTWDVPAGTWQVFAIYAGLAGQHPFFDAREDPEYESLVLDHLAARPVRNHLEYHLGRARAYAGEHFGRELRAFFTPSPELLADWLWTDDFLAEFEKRRGYDLAPYLPVGYVPGRNYKILSDVIGDKVPCFDLPGDMGERIRYDYDQTVSDLFTEAFVRAMTDWADANNLQNRIQVHGIRVDLLKAYSMAHIPETAQSYAGGVLDFMRLAGSASVVYDKRIVTGETLGWSQRDYLTTPLKWKVAADRLFVAGANQLIYHGFPYQHPAFPYPGYQPFSTPYLPNTPSSSSNLARQNPFWEFFPVLNGYVTRCQSLLQQGRTVANIGVYYPWLGYPDTVLKKEELVGGYLDEYDTPPAANAPGAMLKRDLDPEERWVQAEAELGDHLQANGYFYVHINPENLLAARCEEGKLIVGAARLDTLILSQVRRLTVENARKLQEIVIAGIPVVFVSPVPHQQPGFRNYRDNDTIVARIASELSRRPSAMAKSVADVPAHLRDTLGVRPGISFAEPQPTIQHIHKQMEEADIYFLRHSGREPHTVSVCFPHPGCMPYLLDPWTGSVTLAAQYEEVEDGIRLDLSFPPYGSLLVAFRWGPKVTHVIRGDLPVSREAGAVIARTTARGDYTFTFSDGTERPMHVATNAPLPLALLDWHLDAELDLAGQKEMLHLDLHGLKDWRETRELRYCSSKGLYSTRVNLDEQYLQPGLTVALDLGRVHDAAVVVINGQTLPPLLAYPYTVDVTPHLRLGENEIQVTVTPTLYNQLVGYGNAGNENWRHFKGRKDLAPAGLVGPAYLRPAWQLEI